MTELERLAKQIMTECEKNGEPVTIEEATEMAKMELGNRQIKRYEQSDKPRKKAERVRKVDTEKAFLLNLLYNSEVSEVATMTAKRNEAEFSFTYKDNAYTVKLIKHRPPKK